MSNHTQETLASLLETIDRQIIAACIAVRAAKGANARGRSNEAIGALLPAENHLRLALDLYNATLALHRTPLPCESEGAQ
jgi:hypothetical protein